MGTGSLGPGGGACGLSRAEPPASSSATGSALLFVARGCRRCHFKNADEINHRSRGARGAARHPGPKCRAAK